MKHAARHLLTALLLLGVVAAVSAETQGRGWAVLSTTHITLHVTNEPLSQVLAAVASQSGVPIVTDSSDTSTTPISVNEDKISLEKVLQKIAGHLNYSMIYEMRRGQLSRIVISSSTNTLDIPPMPDIAPTALPPTIALDPAYTSRIAGTPIDPVVLANPMPTPEELIHGPRLVTIPDHFRIKAPVSPLVAANPLPTPEQIKSGQFEAPPLPEALQNKDPVDPLVTANPMPTPEQLKSGNGDSKPLPDHLINNDPVDPLVLANPMPTPEQLSGKQTTSESSPGKP